MDGFARSLAFFVAIDDYTNKVPKLSTPVADANDIAEILRTRHDFATELLKNEEATLAGIRAFLADLATRVGPDDRVLFYFAGHGTAIDSETGPVGYLLPQDAERDSASNYLPMRELDAALGALGCRHMLVVLDCCFAGAFRWASTRHLALAPEQLHRERYRWLVDDAAWQAIASAAHDQRALDVADERPLGKRDERQAHSPFAAALIDGLSGNADRAPRGKLQGDGVITATELYLHLMDALVPVDDWSFRQTPMFWPLKKHDKGEFLFLAPGIELNLPPAPALDEQSNPWRGLKPYESADSNLFFGRKRASERLLEQVLQGSLVVVTGPSGTGKSSLVRAGLLPRLPASIASIVVKPGPAPFASLAAALREISGSAPDAATLEAGSQALALWVKEQQLAGRSILLVVDQAEELVTQSSDLGTMKRFLELVEVALGQPDASPGKRISFTEAEARAALTSLGYSDLGDLEMRADGTWRASATLEGTRTEAVLEAPTRALRVVLTIRSEFEPQLAQSPLKERWRSSRYFVPQMTQDELRRVIEGPATAKVMRFQSAELVDILVNDVVQMPGALPLLSFALSEMYLSYLRRPAHDRVLSQQDYQALEGGVAGSLRVSANRAIDGFDELHRLTARRVLQRLVSVESGELARRRVARRELEAADANENERVEKVVEQLVRERLLVSDQVDGEPSLELAHDALILGWDRLLNWVREDLDRIIGLRRLTADAEAWRATGNRGVLWDDAARIPLVKDLQAAPTPGLNALEQRFARESLRRSKRNLRVWWGTAAVLVLLTVGAIFFGIQSYQTSVAALAAQSQFLFDAARNIDKSNRLSRLLVLLEASPDHNSSTLANRIRPWQPHISDELADLWYGWSSSWSERETLQLRVAGLSPDGAYAAVLQERNLDIVRLSDSSAIATLLPNDNEADDPAETPVFVADAETWARLKSLGFDHHNLSVTIHVEETEAAEESEPSVDIDLAQPDFDSGSVHLDLEGRDAFLAPLPPTTCWVRSFRSSDGKFLATIARDGEVSIWDTQRGTRISTLQRSPTCVSLLDFARDGNVLLTVDADSISLSVWELKTGKLLKDLGSDGNYGEARFCDTSGSKIIYDVSLEGSYSGIFDVETGNSQWGDVGTPKSIRSSPRGGYLIVNEREFFRWRDCSSAFATASDNPASMTVAVLSNDEALLVAGRSDGSLSLRSHSGVEAEISGHGGEVTALAISLDNNQILSAGSDGTLRAWRRTTESFVERVFHQWSVSEDIAVSLDGRFLMELIEASDHGGDWVLLWNLREAREIKGLGSINGSGIAGLEFSGDSLRLTARYHDGAIRAFDLSGVAAGATVLGEPEDTSDGSAELDARCETVKPVGLRFNRPSDGNPGTVRRSAPSALSQDKSTHAFVVDGAQIVVCRSQGNSFGQLRSIAADRPVRALAISTQGKFVVATYENGTSSLWSTESGRPVSGSPESVRYWAVSDHLGRVLFEREGRLFVVGIDGEALTDDVFPVGANGWITQDRLAYVNFEGTEGRVVVLQGRRIRSFDALRGPEEVVALAQAALPRCLTKEQRESFHLGQPPRWCLERRAWPYHEMAEADSSWETWLLAMWDRLSGAWPSAN